MSALEGDIERHYGAEDVSARVLRALTAAGKDLERLSRADLSPFDEFHGGGLASTRDLATFAALAAGLEVLDIGCGIGGPARTLAAEFGCRVTGIDLTHEFVRAATMLTARLGMQASCRFQQGSATDLPCAAATFDIAWSQNMLMNIADKPRFFAEVARVLKPGGRLALETVVAGDGRQIHLPVFWAARLEHNFLVTGAELKSLACDAGLVVDALEDTTQAVIANGRKRQAAIAADSASQLTVAVIVPDDVPLKMANALRNNEEGRTRTVKALFRKPA